MNGLYRTSIRGKLLAAYLPLIILPVVVISVASYALFSYKMSSASRMLAEQNAKEINRHLETYLDELERLSLFPYFHTNVMDVLRDNRQFDSPEQMYQEYKMFDDMFGNIMLNPRQDLLNVFLYRSDGTRYFNTRVNVTLNGDYDWKTSDWYRRTLEADGAVVYTPNAGRDGRFTVLPYDIFSISRLIKSDNGQVVGTILIDANFQGVEDVLRDIGLGQKSNVVLKDQSGQILFAQNGLYLDQLKSLRNAENVTLRADGEKLFVGSDVSAKTGWTASVVIPSENIYRSFISIREVILWLAAIFGAIALIVTFWLSGSITRPIREMYRMMKKVESGQYDVELNVTSQDEIGSLGRAFNKMSSQIKELIHEVYEFEIRQKEAELNNLKMQIRPHFLYNTLEAIRSLAELSDNREIVEMTGSLGSILRYSIKTHQKLVLLDKELDYIRQYLNIHQIMNGDAVRFEFDIEPDVRRRYSIPLMFQPIIENALQHGLYGRRSGGLLRISGKAENEALTFTIADNGVGIPPGDMEELNAKLSEPALPHRADAESADGIGLLNVNRRLKIVFGDAYGLTVGPNPGGGTVVSVRIPAVSDQREVG
ncbi:cache domain-containing sensor histidine kinase [Cohnella caldifontis]|uniref:cache domain-containing sensor histidine kinase n=1 Tax=Cohnella caldifontis TaxID=3027471 RepID=UPI0023EB4683|nr:sensor histidine kinase [Cohnella sp. YIM B05605]